MICPHISKGSVRLNSTYMGAAKLVPRVFSLAWPQAREKTLRARLGRASLNLAW